MRIRVKYSEDYKHFDKLIWQVPTWCTAIFTGVLVASNEVMRKYLQTWGINQNIFLSLMLGSGFVFLFSLSYALFRYRWHQAHTIDKTKPPFAKISAQFFLQLSVSLQSVIFLALILQVLLSTLVVTLSTGILALIIMTIYYEVYIYKGVKNGQATLFHYFIVNA